MQLITPWLNVSTVNDHHQANKEHLLKVQKFSTQWDPISFTVEYKVMYEEFLFTINTIKM